MTEFECCEQMRPEPAALDSLREDPDPKQSDCRPLRIVRNLSGRCVDNVNRIGAGLGDISVGLTRIRDVFWNSQCLQGLECDSSPTSGTTFSLVRGDFALTC